MKNFKNKKYLFCLAILFARCEFSKPNNVPVGAKKNNSKQVYEYIDPTRGYPVKKEWSFDGYLRTESFEVDGKNIKEYYRFDELEKKIIEETLPNSEKMIRKYNMKNTLLSEVIRGADYEDKTTYNWDGSFRERKIIKNGQEEKAPPRQIPNSIPKNAIFNYVFKAWESGVLINNKKNGVWKLWQTTGEEYGFITYLNDIYEGRMFLKKKDIIYLDIYMKNGQIYSSPYLEKKVLNYFEKFKEVQRKDNDSDFYKNEANYKNCSQTMFGMDFLQLQYAEICKECKRKNLDFGYSKKLNTYKCFPKQEINFLTQKYVEAD